MPSLFSKAVENVNLGELSFLIFKEETPLPKDLLAGLPFSPAGPDL